MIARLLISPSIEARVGEIEKMVRSTILSEVEGSHDLQIRNHPDVLYFPADSKLGIEQARQIKEHFSLKPYQAMGRAVVLEDASQMTVEAQNALLKTLEEPPAEAMLILSAPSDAKFLPTVLSRCQVVILEGAQATNRISKDSITLFQNDLEKLLESDIETRFEYIEKLKDREEFLKFMVHFFRQEMIDSTHARPGLARLNQFLKELLQAEEWVEHNVNPRAILEYLMLVMPTPK